MQFIDIRFQNAATGNWSTIIDLLVTRSQADVDTRNPFNMYSPMHCAAACNNVEAMAVKFMIIKFSFRYFSR